MVSATNSPPFEPEGLPHAERQDAQSPMGEDRTLNDEKRRFVSNGYGDGHGSLSVSVKVQFEPWLVTECMITRYNHAAWS